MTQLDIDRLSDRELTDLTTKLCRQVMSRRKLAMPLAIPGESQKPVAFLVPTPHGYDPPSEEYWAELRRRMADPNATFLTVDEFLDALDDYWTKTDSTAGQLDSVNGHQSHTG
jgi:hypothetical protein